MGACASSDPSPTTVYHLLPYRNTMTAFPKRMPMLTELHERAAVGGEDDAHPVEGVRRLGRLHAVDGDLAAHQEDEEGDDSPEHLLPEGNLIGPFEWCTAAAWAEIEKGS